MPHTVPMSDATGQSDRATSSPARGSWREMVAWCDALVVERTGETADAWADRARADGVTEEGPLRAWLAEHAVTGYASNAVEWKVLGYPESFLKDADELLEAQYADRPGLRPVADAILAWAESNGASVQVRKTVASLMARRKFAQVAPQSKSAVTVLVRVTERLDAPFEQIRTPADDPFDQRVRLRTLDDLTDDVFAVLSRALDEGR